MEEGQAEAPRWVSLKKDEVERDEQVLAIRSVSAKCQADVSDVSSSPSRLKSDPRITYCITAEFGNWTQHTRAATRVESRREGTRVSNHVSAAQHCPVVTLKTTWQFRGPSNPIHSSMHQRTCINSYTTTRIHIALTLPITHETPAVQMSRLLLRRCKSIMLLYVSAQQALYQPRV